MNKQSIQSGEVFITNEGEECIVVEYISSSNVVVSFSRNPWYKRKVKAGDLRRGRVRNPYRPSIYGIGFTGEGVYLQRSEGKLTKEFERWKNMMARAYCEKHKARYPTYIGCSVAPEWHNFQTFAEWLRAQPLWDSSGSQLDKDLLVKGNKIYSPDTCAIVPGRINALLVRPPKSKGLPVGVFKHHKSGRFLAKCGNGSDKSTVIGVYDCPEEAFSAYKGYKEGLMREAAQDNKGLIDERVYIALMNYQVEP